jgi:FkbM family methyltransferase
MNTKLKRLFCRIFACGNREFGRVSFSQEGEDLILDRLFNNKAEGFYVDVGAHHPMRFSNTYSFYLRGWQGINIDAMPGSMKTFQTVRPKDVNLELAISNTSEEMTLYVFEETALNTFCRDVAEEYIRQGWPLRFKKQITMQRLSDVLDRYLPKNQAIDFLNIDAEGLDFEVLTSNNWEKYEPTVVLIEELDRNFDHLYDSKVVRFMKSRGYELYCKAVNTLIFGNKAKLSHLQS